MDKQITISDTDRWHYIDLMKSIAILFVIMYHATTYPFSFLENNSSLFFLRYYLRTILSTCVPLFFFVNGYLMLNRSFDLKKHIVKTVRIIILTGVWCIITVILLMFIKNENLSLKEFAFYVCTWQSGWTNHLWYMGALVWIYIFFPLLKVTFDNHRKAFIYFTIICTILTFGNTFLTNYSSIILNMTGKYNGMININWFSIFNPLRGIYFYSFAYFCIGGLAHCLANKLPDIPQKRINIVAIVTIVFSCFCLFVTGMALSKIYGMMWDVVWDGYDSVFTLMNVCMIFMLCVSYQGNNRIIKLISVNTLGIYFLHIIFIRISTELVKTVPIFQSFLGCGAYSLLILFVCLAFTMVMVKIPIVKRLFKL